MGQVAPLSLSMPAEAGQPYMLCLSLGYAPGLVLPQGGLLPLNFDFLLELSLDPASPFCLSFQGVLGPAGTASPALFVPPLPFLAGWQLHAAGFTFDPVAIAEREITHWIRTTLAL